MKAQREAAAATTPAVSEARALSPAASLFHSLSDPTRLAILRHQGRASMFSLAAEPRLMELLAAAERLLAETGDAVDLCPTYGSTARTAGKGR